MSAFMAPFVPNKVLKAPAINPRLLLTSKYIQTTQRCKTELQQQFGLTQNTEEMRVMHLQAIPKLNNQNKI